MRASVLWASPEEYGGIPCDKVTLGMMIEELYHSSGCNHILYQNSLTAFDIVEFGTPEQIQKYMDAYMETGWPLCSLSISEPVPALTTATCRARPKSRMTGRIV